MTQFGIFVALLVLAADQLTKWMASLTLVDGGVVILPGFIDLVIVHNIGAAFGLFAGWSAPWRLGILAGVAVLAIGLMLHLIRLSTRYWSAGALALVLGGAVGNLVDRLRWGWVVDFIHLHWHDLSWPVFNVADSAITLGIGMLLWEHFFHAGDGES
ncbi:MAG: signal peptidase II [Magnetococcales bacterium]|nr:signal peptidase II [Magnetococcales bacterium]MBF0321708.1 signal peptidase II [Magnetococcales bacterium]